jgi:BirA family biotin operon repressor/biotin-[acetyl-CoA-carboxylase] ligase
MPGSRVRKRLLDILADGEFHSGEQLGQALGISRTAIWKHIKRLEQDGMRLESVRGKGYRLLDSGDFLDRDAIWSGLQASTRNCLAALEVFDSLESTNTHALQRGQAAYVCLAEQQTGGRGRRGRRWESPFGKNIYLSLLYEYEGGAAVLEGLSLAVGLAVVEALAQQGVEDLALKWPNDLVWHDRKLGGILLELAGDPAGLCQVVIGVGINVHMKTADVDEIDQPWVSLDEAAGRALDRTHLVAACLDQLLPLLAQYESHGFQPLQARWTALDVLAGQAVVLHIGDRQVAGTARGVNERGQLAIETPLGIQHYSGGEVSVRRAG